MKFTHYYLDCLSQASYLIGDETTGRAVVVDPRRDVSDYLTDAAEAGLMIELVIETHFHADFLSGHLELAQATGAEIAYSSVADTDFASRKLGDGERIELGDVVLEIRHTPGHTPESISIVVWEHRADVEPYAVLTGDTLFVGDVGRPDLLASVGHTSDELAADLYRSLQTKLLVLPDATRVYPAHGAGSSCGKNLSSETSSTIGEQRRTNPALLTADESAFIEFVTEGQSPAPAYFAHDADLNRRLRPLLVEGDRPETLALPAVQRFAESGAVLLDVRNVDDFAAGHVPGAINIGLGGRFAEFAGSVIRPDVDIVIIAADHDAAQEAKVRLARIGFDRVVGHLGDPLLAGLDSSLLQGAERWNADELAGVLAGESPVQPAAGPVQLVDIRNPGEVALGTIPGALAIPLGQLGDRIDELASDAQTVVFCAGGYRSSIGASLLRSAGFDEVADVVGGYTAWADSERVGTVSA